jgi:hypothetical protein
VALMPNAPAGVYSARVLRLALLAAVAGALAIAAPASAEVVLVKDREGRTITFDVQAPDVDVEWYAELLRNAAHGDEIARVTVRVVATDDLRMLCGSGAGGCYSGTTRGGRIVVPAARTAMLAHTVVHEYAHHLDASYGVPGTREPNGTPRWWTARDMARRLAAGEVSRTYSLGWDRAIAEVFAEDYVQLHLQTPHRIRWLTPPDETVVAALRADLAEVTGGAGAPPPAAPAPPPASTAPVVVTRRGTIGARRSVSVPYELLGPGRRVTFSARLGVATAGAQARMEIRCEGEPPILRALVRGRTTTLDLRHRGPARCDAIVRNTGRVRATFTSTLRLSLEPALAGTSRSR